MVLMCVIHSTLPREQGEGLTSKKETGLLFWVFETNLTCLENILIVGEAGVRRASKGFQRHFYLMKNINWAAVCGWRNRKQISKSSPMGALIYSYQTVPFTNIRSDISFGSRTKPDVLFFYIELDSI
jgi:hypothetical protein